MNQPRIVTNPEQRAYQGLVRSELPRGELNRELAALSQDVLLAAGQRLHVDLLGADAAALATLIGLVDCLLCNRNRARTVPMAARCPKI